jgi:hypothetical protein
MASIPTVEVNRGGHRCIINQSDFDPSRDTLWTESTDAVQKTKEKTTQRQVTPEAPADALSRPAIEARLAELQELAKDWRQIKPVAESAGITEKPADGWDTAVLPILVAEYGQVAAEEAYTNPEVAADE